MRNRPAPVLAGAVLLSLALGCLPAPRARADDAAPTPPAAKDPKDATLGFHDEGEAGVVVTTGNALSQSFDLKELGAYGWGANLLKLTGKYLSASAGGVESARNWLFGLRYERELTQLLSVFAGQNVESNVFSGYVQRYNTDVGAKYFLYKEEAFYWDVEAGYRYTIENRLTGSVGQNYLRFYTEANRDWTKTFSTKLDLEYLPNLTVTNDFQLNAGFSLSSALNDVFAVKLGYTVKYRNLPPPPATHDTDTQFTTALVAKL